MDNTAHPRPPHRAPDVELARLIREFRINANTDVQFAQRVALVCCHLVETKADPLDSIRKVFQIAGT